MQLEFFGAAGEVTGHGAITIAGSLRIDFGNPADVRG